jgi:hypothetical protein
MIGTPIPLHRFSPGAAVLLRLSLLLPCALPAQDIPLDPLQPVIADSNSATPSISPNPPLPAVAAGSPTVAESALLDQGGYFPTAMESRILSDGSGGNADYARARGDGGAWTYSGLWPVKSAPDNFYQRNGAFFDRVERGLGPFVNNESMLAAHDSGRIFSLTGNYGLGFLTRDVYPDRSMIKMGPLVLDFLGINTSLIYTDYSGDAPLEAGIPNRGWIAMIGFPIRASLRITDSIYIQAFGMPYYLPFENEFGIASGFGSGFNLGLQASINHEWVWNDTFFRIYDTLGTAGNFLDMIEQWEVGEIDAAGRYRFGNGPISGQTAGGFGWNPQLGGIANFLGFEAQREITNEWWLYSLIEHGDFWASNGQDFTDHIPQDRLNVEMRYIGDDLWFAPSIGYQALSTDWLETLTHQVYARFTGRITEYLTAFGSAGYLWQSGENTSDVDTALWEVGLTHDLTSYTSHSLSGGNIYTISPSFDEQLAEYARYTINHTFSAALSASLFAQWANVQFLNGDLRGGEQYQYGGFLRCSLTASTRLFAGTSYTTFDDRISPMEEQTWTHFITLEQPIVGRLTSSLSYQYIDQSGDFGFNMEEHLLIMSLNLAF